MKIFDAREAENYRAMQACKDPLQRFTPKFHGEVDPEELSEEFRGTHYMRLSNLLKSFGPDPYVMDCKIGIRSFAEAEAKNDELRKDLYLRLISLDPTAPSKEEREAMACTKYRWMNFNDELTNLNSLGFRLEGITQNIEKIPKERFTKVRTVSDMADCIRTNFLQTPTNSIPPGKRIRVSSMILKDLRELRMVAESSPLVQNHSIVGASLLFVVDLDAGGPCNGGNGGVFMIDFAKTDPLPPGVTVTHSLPWVRGNYEDGLFTGLDNMILCWEEVCKLSCEETLSPPPI
jgi:1D-myo-inositol-triphosphate 3-kinase